MSRAICTLHNSSKSKYEELLSISDNTTRIGYNTTKISYLRPINLGCRVNSINGDNNSINESPDPEEATKFWKDTWATPTGHDRMVKRVKNMLKELGRQGEISVSFEDVKHGKRRMAIWKAPGPDGVHGF